MKDLPIELLKGAIALAVTLIGLGVGWLVGKRLSYQWNVRQKQRELDLAAAQDFQHLYGEFFAVWKLWNGLALGRDGQGRGRGRGGRDSELHGEVLRRAADAEGLVERLIIKLATERPLQGSDLESLGKFRQAYQQLRRAVESGDPLEWNSSEHPEYLAFKRLAVEVIAIVQRDSAATPLSPAEAFESLREVTSNRHETSWAEGKTAEPAPPPSNGTWKLSGTRQPLVPHPSGEQQG